MPVSSRQTEHDTVPEARIILGPGHSCFILRRKRLNTARSQELSTLRWLTPPPTPISAG